MKDPTDSIITAFYNRLNGNLSYNNQDWPFKTFGEISDTYDNVSLIDVTIEDDSDEDERIHECTILLDVKQGSKKSASWKGTNFISSQIVNLIAYQELEFEDFELVREITFGSNLLQEYTDTHIILRKLLRFRFKLQEE